MNSSNENANTYKQLKAFVTPKALRSFGICFHIFPLISATSEVRASYRTAILKVNKRSPSQVIPQPIIRC